MNRLWLLLGLLLSFGGQALQAQNARPKFEEPPIGEYSNAWLRLYHFYAPRAYPHENVPPNLWLDGRRQAELMEITRPSSLGIGIQSHQDWEFMGPTATNAGWLARINAIIVDRANTNIIYAGVSKGGVWKSADDGTTWANLTDTISQYVGCLTQDPINANTIYMGTGEEYFALNTLGGVGIYKSTDGGANWTLHGNSTFSGYRINAIVIDPANTSKWIVSSSRGIHVTTNNGLTFTQRLSGVASALLMHPTDPNILYAALGYPFGGSSANANGIYKSTDGGTNWTQVAGGFPSGNAIGRIELDIHKNNPNILYAIISNPSGHRIHSIWKTTNAGVSWTSLSVPSEPYGQGWYDLLIRVDPTDPNIAYIGTVYLWRTTNGGSSWSAITPDHTDMHTLEFHPANAQTIFLGQDAGLYVSTNRGTNWTKKNTGRGTMEYYAFDVHPTDPNRLAAGAQDNATQVRATGNSFNVVIGGDGFWTAYKKTNPNIMLGESQYGRIARSTNGGSGWSVVFNLGSAENGRSGWSTPLLNDPTSPSRFYAGSYRLWRSNSDGASNTWSAVSSDLTGGGNSTLSRIAIAPGNGDVVYTGASSGKVFVSANATAASPTWTDRTAGLPTRTIGGIAVDPNNPNIVYVGLMGSGSGRVYKSVNGGANWTNYSGNLPDVPVTGLVINPVNTGQLLASTDIGVFLTSNGTTWTRYGADLPTTPCTHLLANAATGYLTVSTYGRGMWRILLPGLNPPPALSSLNPTSKAQNSGAFTLTINGTNFVTGSVARWNGADRATTYLSETQVTVNITAADIQTAGTANVTVFNPLPGGGTSNTLTFTITEPPLRALSGTVTLQDSPGAAFEATFVLHPTDNSGDITRNAPVNAQGAFTLNSVPAKNYRVTVKTPNTLSRALNADATSGNVSGLAFPALQGGDANNDNSVDVLDLDLLIQTFDLCQGDAGFDAGADFNSDDCVDVLDLDILIRNFDQRGEE